VQGQNVLVRSKQFGGTALDLSLRAPKAKIRPSGFFEIRLGIFDGPSPATFLHMQPDSQFIDNYVAAVRDEPSALVRDDWVDARLAHDFMRNVRTTVVVGSGVGLLTVILLYGHVNAWGLTAWFIACVGIIAYRQHTMYEYKKLSQAAAGNVDILDVSRFFARHGWSWPASAVIFASPIFLHYEKAPEALSYLSLMITVGLGAVGASLMAARIRCQRQFSHALCLTAVAAILHHWWVKQPSLPTRSSVGFLLLILLFWASIVYLGRHLHLLQRNSYSAQFDNEQLIRSLRQQTLAATEAVQMKNNLLASATHDLRQPVHALAFYADWLRNEPTLADSITPKILAATDSVNTLFNSLFDFARIEAGGIKLHLTEVELAPLIHEMAVQFAPAADIKGLSLRMNPVSAKVISDPVLLRRIVSNLVANAIRYTDKGGVVVTARKVGTRLWLEVIDSGPGIAPEHLPHVFKEFYRAPVHEGTADSFGLGLAIVQRLCRALGHTVSLRSSLGKGTRARLDMALIDEQASSSATSQSPPFVDDLDQALAQIKPRERAQ
jgi:signal transduction histidine kinase